MVSSVGIADYKTLWLVVELSYEGTALKTYFLNFLSKISVNETFHVISMTSLLLIIVVSL